VAVRIPVVFLGGRFWAEEGAVFFHNALTEPWWAALFAVHTGYVNLIANLATLLAAQVPLEHAPQVTAVIALGVQTLPAVVLATSRLPWLRSAPSLTLALLLLATVPGAGEVWVNSITSHFHMMLAAALVLMIEPRQDRLRWLHRGILVLAPLTGPGAEMLAPLFVLRALVERSRQRAVQAALIVAASMVQLGIIATHPEPARVYQASLPLLIGIMYVKHVLTPLLGPWVDAPAHAVHDVVQQGHWPLTAMVITPVVFAAMAAAVAASRRPELRWSFAAGLVFALLSYFGAVANQSTDLLYWWVGARYAFAPSVLFALTLLGLAYQPGLARWPARLVVGCMLVVGLARYPHVLATFATGPDWQHEVAAWRADPGHVLRIWPTGWVMELPRR
ncbi:MAG TPA: hypothetical protein VFW82_15045, partial [Dyella sp.]|nr:hypothetical protein [Dyella sp.]